MNREALSLNEVVQKAESMLQRLIGEDIRLIIRCHDQTPPVTDTGCGTDVHILVPATKGGAARAATPEHGRSMSGGRLLDSRAGEGDSR